MSKTTKEIAKRPETAMERPDFIPANDVRGTEGIGRDDVKMPRIILAQGLTAQVQEAKDGFQVGVLFHETTEEIYGKGPLDFCVLRVDPPRWIEFWHKDSGQKGVKRMNVPRVLPDDSINPDTEWGPNGEPPVATKFYDYIVGLLPIDPSDPMDRIAALSLKGVTLKAGRLLNTMIKRKRAAVFSPNYVVSSFSDKNAKGTYANLRFDSNGWAATQAEYALREALFEILKDKDVTIERGTGEDAEDAERE